MAPKRRWCRTASSEDSLMRPLRTMTPQATLVLVGHEQAVRHGLLAIPHNVRVGVFAARAVTDFALQPTLKMKLLAPLPVFLFPGGGMTTEAHFGFVRFLGDAAELGNLRGEWRREGCERLGVLGEAPLAVLMPHGRTVVAGAASLGSYVDRVAHRTGSEARRRWKEEDEEEEESPKSKSKSEVDRIGSRNGGLG